LEEREKGQKENGKTTPSRRIRGGIIVEEEGPAGMEAIRTKVKCAVKPTRKGHVDCGRDRLFKLTEKI
jgi:hypothetical protein